MERTEYNLLEESPSTVKKLAIYFSDVLGGKNYNEIMNYYKLYDFSEHLDTIRNEYECQSYSTIMFSINFLIKGAVKKYIILTAAMEIPDWEEVEYTNYPSGIEDEETINELLTKNYKSFIKAEMIIKFYIKRNLDQYNIEEEEELFDEGEPAIVEPCFI